ncbi:MAG: hypothetical protein R3361_08265 [Aequorivita vladivostokensis]|nr:hypothetical protein [Aequorivita vladivostokensis]
MEITIKRTATGQPTEKQMAAAEKLTQKLLDDVGRGNIARFCGVSGSVPHRWRLVPAKYVLAVCIKYGQKLDKLRPDMVLARKD